MYNRERLYFKIVIVLGLVLIIACNSDPKKDHPQPVKITAGITKDQLTLKFDQEGQVLQVDRYMLNKADSVKNEYTVNRNGRQDAFEIKVPLRSQYVFPLNSATYSLNAGTVFALSFCSKRTLLRRKPELLKDRLLNRNGRRKLN